MFRRIIITLFRGPILDLVNEVIDLAFDSAQSEVDDLFNSSKIDAIERDRLSAGVVLVSNSARYQAEKRLGKFLA